MISFDFSSFIKTLPAQPGVYRMLDGQNTVIYVGKARDLKRRVASYFQKQHDNPRTRLMVTLVARIEVTLTASEAEALLLECNLIKQLQPRFNVLFKDDKSHPYILLTAHPFPQIRLYRGELDPRHRYFGPYPNAWAAREVIGHLQKLFQLRTCADTVFKNRSRACLLHQIGRCKAPCVGLVSVPEYEQDLQQAMAFLQGRESDILDTLRAAMQQAAQVQNFEWAAQIRDRIALMQQVLSRQSVSSRRDTDVDIIATHGSAQHVVLNLVMIRAGRHLGDKSFFPQNADSVDESTVIEAFMAQHYSALEAPGVIVASAVQDPEGMAQLLSQRFGRVVQIITHPQGEKRAWYQGALQNARFALEQHQAQQATQGLRLDALQQSLGLATLPTRIECFDISHLQGEATVASCVVFEAGKPFKADYRRYNIEGITPGDDYAAMRQVLQRRFQPLAKGEGKRPDLILIDGGRGQLNAAWKMMQDLGLNDLMLVGVAKGEGRKPGLETLVFPQTQRALSLPQEDLGFHLIQAIRDEAHRFAITGHRARRGKSRLHSTLQEIEGIGAKRRQKLLVQFGGLRGVQNASVEDIAAIPGIGSALAHKIWRQLH